MLALGIAGAAPAAAAGAGPGLATTAVAFDGARAAGVAARLAHGERLSRVLGCRGCHGDDLRGRKWDDDPREYGVMWASNLTRAVPRMTDAALERLLRSGRHPTRAVLWAMPSQIFQHLSAPDMVALIAHLRALPPGGALSPPPQPGPKALAEIASGRYLPAAAMVRNYRDVLPVDAGPAHRLGRYVASVTCTECHGMRLEGAHADEGTTPDLIVASAYEPAAFDRFITTGEAPGERRIHPLMVQVARGRFAHLTRPERAALYAYLRARAALPH